MRASPESYLGRRPGIGTAPGCGKREFLQSLQRDGGGDRSRPDDCCAATALSRMRSNAQRKQLNHAYSDQQHHKRHGIVIQPVSFLCAHDIPLVRFLVDPAVQKVQAGRARYNMTPPAADLNG